MLRLWVGSQPVKNLVLWRPPEPLQIGQGNRKTHISQMLEDLPELDIKDITRVGNNREVWRELIRNSNLSSRQKQPNHDDDDEDSGYEMNQ